MKKLALILILAAAASCNIDGVHAETVKPSCKQFAEVIVSGGELTAASIPGLVASCKLGADYRKRGASDKVFMDIVGTMVQFDDQFVQTGTPSAAIRAQGAAMIAGFKGHALP